MKYYCIGIDVSKDDFHASLCTREGMECKFSAVKKWDNSKKGFGQLLRWAKKEVPKGSEFRFLMEATGVYHEELAYFLYEKSNSVHVVLPNKSKHYFDSLNVKSKTDKLDSKVLAQFGVERKHSLWQPPKPIYRKLRDHTRYKLQLQQQKNALTNIGHSKEYSAHVDSNIIKANARLVKQLEKEIAMIKNKIEEIVASDVELQERIRRICTIKGCKIQTAATIVAETNGFEQIRSMKQLASFSGYDVVQHQSGSSILKKGKISKKGNRYIRAALYFPAMSASKHCPELASTYQNLVQQSHIKMKGQVAVQRKLLLLIYTLWKTGEEYIPDYNKKKVAKAKALATQDNTIMAFP